MKNSWFKKGIRKAAISGFSYLVEMFFVDVL